MISVTWNSPELRGRKKFKAVLTHIQYSGDTVVVKAASLGKAKEKAEEISLDEVLDWNPVDGDLIVESAESVEYNETKR